MTHQIRYPSNVSEGGDGVSWEDLDNIRIDNWESLAICNINGKVKSKDIIATNFKFNIPIGSKINQIAIFHDYHRNSSENPINIEPPIIELTIGDITLKLNSHVSADIHSMERSLAFIGEDIDDITAKSINDNDISVKVKFPKNSFNTEGLLYFDYIRIRIDYEEKRYVLSSGESNSYYPIKENPILKAIGDTFRYTVSFRNVNGVSDDKQEVLISIPKEFEIEKYYFKSNKTNKLDQDDADFEDKFDDDKLIWYPSVRGKGVSHIRFILKCVKEGTYSINSYNKDTGLTSNFYVEVHDENYEAPHSKFDETTNIWTSEVMDSDDFSPINQEIAIKVDNVSMEFELAKERVDNLKEYVIRWIKRDLPSKKHFKALNNVNFEINKGERVGIIGFNGAGKSTLLKVLSGVLKPTTGTTFTNGKIAPLLELGAGFDHNYNGRENIFLNGAILGYSKEFLESKYDEIVEFSELEEFIETPIKNYSSGMNAKLGFAVATVVNPDILILDEILSVGDVRFQKKSGDKIKSMMRSGTTVLLVSHSVAKIRELCTRAIWLDKGTVIMDGEVDYVCDAYIEAAKKASEAELQNIELE